MNKLLEMLKKTGVRILSAIRRFPATVALSAIVMALSLVLMHNEATLTESARQWLTRVMLTLGLGIPLSVALKLFLERREGRLVWQVPAAWLALGGLLALYLVFLLPETDREIPMTRYLALMVASVALAPAIPYLINRQGSERFALKLLLRLLTTALFTGILIGGIDLVLLMLERLLAVKLWDKAYLDTAIVSFGLFAPSFMLSGIPRKDSDIEAEPFQPLVRILIGYIAYPLLGVYTVIVYGYFIRILAEWAWPSNMLVNMVLWYTAIGVLAIYFMRSLNTVNRWFRLFDAWYPRLTILPIALMMIGLFIRIGAYGFTERRYFVLVAALWVSAATLLFILIKPQRRLNLAAPVLAAALAALAVLGPWDAFNVSAGSQNARLQSVLRQNGMLSADGKAAAAQKVVPDGDKQTIYSILDYFESTRGLDAAAALPAGTSLTTLPQALGFDRPTAPGLPGIGIYISSGSMTSMLDVSGYDYVFISGYSFKQAVSQSGTVMMLDENWVFSIAVGGREIYSKDMKEYAKLYEASYAPDRVYSALELTQVDENGSVSVKYMLNQISINYIDGVAEYMVPDFFALVKLK